MISNHYADPKPPSESNTPTDVSLRSSSGSAEKEVAKEDVCEICKEHKRGTKEIGVASTAAGLLIAGLAILEKYYLG